MVLLKWKLQHNFYFFQSLIITVSQKLLNNIQRIISKFVRGNNKPRIKALLFQQRIQQGGLSFSNITLYYSAVYVVMVQLTIRVEDKTRHCWEINEAMTKRGRGRWERGWAMFKNSWGPLPFLKTTAAAIQMRRGGTEREGIGGCRKEEGCDCIAQWWGRMTCPPIPC